MQLEISLPDEAGRLQILNIHTAKMAEAKKLAPDVNLKELAAKTKNFSGAEIEGLCRAAAFTAMYQLVKVLNFYLFILSYALLIGIIGSLRLGHSKSFSLGCDIRSLVLVAHEAWVSISFNLSITSIFPYQ